MNEIMIAESNSLGIPEEEFLSRLRKGDLIALHEYEISEPTYERLCAVAAYSLTRIPKKLHTKEICLITIQNNESSIQDVSKNVLDEEFYLAAAQLNGLVLRWVDSKIITPEMVVAAVTSAGMVL